MAIDKNDFKNAEGNYEAKNALMDAVIDGVNGNEANISLLQGLGKVEEIYIPAGTETRFDVPPNSSRFFILTPNTDNKTFVMSVVRFSSANQYVKHILHDNADFSVAKNASGSAVFITPTYASRGLMITT